MYINITYVHSYRFVAFLVPGALIMQLLEQNQGDDKLGVISNVTKVNEAHLKIIACLVLLVRRDHTLKSLVLHNGACNHYKHKAVYIILFTR